MAKLISGKTLIKSKIVSKETLLKIGERKAFLEEGTYGVWKFRVHIITKYIYKKMCSLCCCDCFSDSTA